MTCVFCKYTPTKDAWYIVLYGPKCNAVAVNGELYMINSDKECEHNK